MLFDNILIMRIWMNFKNINIAILHEICRIIDRLSVSVILSALKYQLIKYRKQQKFGMTKFWRINAIRQTLFTKTLKFFISTMGFKEIR